MVIDGKEARGYPLIKRACATLQTAAALCLAGCATLPTAGPSTSRVNAMAKDAPANAKIEIIDVTDAVAGRVIALQQSPGFKQALGDGDQAGPIVGRGDLLDVWIWEAPPAVLFGVLAGSQASSAETLSLARSSTLPEQMVGQDGAIRIPFAGVIPAAGRTTYDIAAEVRARLVGKAHDPQVIVRLARNATDTVTIVGEVNNSLRMPLTAKGERLLDALASAGGVKQPVGKMTIQITRGERVEMMALETVIKDPQQNIRLQANDVVTLLFQPYSFTVLGAARKNEEVPFEGTGLTLSQALGRIGGLDDQRANPKGVFIFRFEDSKMAGGDENTSSPTHGKTPVIYRVNMADPTTLFVAQTFPIKDKDVIYISNAPLADFQKFLQAVTQIVYPIATIQNTNIF